MKKITQLLFILSCLPGVLMSPWWRKEEVTKKEPVPPGQAFFYNRMDKAMLEGCVLLLSPTVVKVDALWNSVPRHAQWDKDDMEIPEKVRGLKYELAERKLQVWKLRVGGSAKLQYIYDTTREHHEILFEHIKPCEQNVKDAKTMLSLSEQILLEMIPLLEEYIEATKIRWTTIAMDYLKKTNNLADEELSETALEEKEHLLPEPIVKNSMREIQENQMLMEFLETDLQWYGKSAALSQAQKELLQYNN